MIIVYIGMNKTKVRSPGLQDCDKHAQLLLTNIGRRSSPAVVAKALTYGVYALDICSLYERQFGLVSAVHVVRRVPHETAEEFLRETFGGFVGQNLASICS